ncbi:hypothetical protein BGZ68_003159 [Mortierella alpina]|nr:hypothetical protein BGZ68_003159 [Mortierella alpina]
MATALAGQVGSTTLAPLFEAILRILAAAAIPAALVLPHVSTSMNAAEAAATAPVLARNRNPGTNPVNDSTDYDILLKSAVLALYSENNVLKSKIQGLSDHLVDLADEAADLRDENKALTGEVADLTDENQAFTDQLLTLTGELFELRGENEALTDQVIQLTGDVVNLTSENQALTSEVANLTGEVTQLRSENQTLIGEVSNLSGQVTELGSRVAESKFVSEVIFITPAILFTLGSVAASQRMLLFVSLKVLQFERVDVPLAKGHGHGAGLRYVILAGEALTPAMLEPWYATHAETSPLVVNMYGPTEITVYATYRPMTVDDCSHSFSPIGVRLPDTRTYVLDGHGLPVPVGAIGELYIGGAGVARGYLNRLELTAEIFVRDPFAEGPASRMYRTGDLVRFLPDGNLLYLGRNDHQVKIRGFRIELGEIETRLAEHSLVSDAVVLAVGEESQKQLVAYIIVRPDDHLKSSTEGDGCKCGNY